jgi:hypothetical protein
MAQLSASLGRVNAVLLLLVTPFIVRIWVEAVVWRLLRGPQMLGFSLLHGGAGWMTLPLVLSFLTIYVYALWVVFIIVLWTIPASRKRITKPQLVVLGGGSVVVFFLIADFLQRVMNLGLVFAGAAAMTAIVCLIVWLIYAGFRSHRRVGTAAPV